MKKINKERHQQLLEKMSCEQLLDYNADLFSLESVLNLIAHSGESSGVGSWRPSSGSPGPNGSFEPDYSNMAVGK